MAALTAAYYGLSRDARTVQRDTAPAILQVAAARTALDDSYEAARRGLESPGAGVEGLGETYRTDIAIANQNLTRAAAGNVAGDTGRGRCSPRPGWSPRTPTTSSVPTSGAARRCRAGPTSATRAASCGTRAAASSTGSTRSSSGSATLREQTSFGWLLALVWTAAGALLAALGLLLWHTWRELRRRFHRRHHLALYAAAALVLAALPLAYSAYGIQSSLADARTELLTGGTTRTAQTARRVDVIMDATHWRAGLAGLVPAGGVALAALVLTGLQPRIDEYRFQPR
ncbi:hypothetical protein NKH77_31610 [Streptomyces sp. M19]